jgi:hypothetical protein
MTEPVTAAAAVLAADRGCGLHAGWHINVSGADLIGKGGR